LNIPRYARYYEKDLGTWFVPVFVEITYISGNTVSIPKKKLSPMSLQTVISSDKKNFDLPELQSEVQLVLNKVLVR